jgi:hypothetical protein
VWHCDICGFAPGSMCGEHLTRDEYWRLFFALRPLALSQRIGATREQQHTYSDHTASFHLDSLLFISRMKASTRIHSAAELENSFRSRRRTVDARGIQAFTPSR